MLSTFILFIEDSLHESLLFNEHNAFLVLNGTLNFNSVHEKAYMYKTKLQYTSRSSKRRVIYSNYIVYINNHAKFSRAGNFIKWHHTNSILSKVNVYKSRGIWRHRGDFDPDL